MSGDPVGAAVVGLCIAFVLLTQVFAWGWPRKRGAR